MSWDNAAETECPFDDSGLPPPSPSALAAANHSDAEDSDFLNFGGAEDALAIIEADEREFMAEASKAREIGEDADIDESLMTSPIAASQFSMRQSPSDYFGSKAPEMGSLSGNRVIKRPRFYSPNECIPFTPRRRTSRRREIVSPHPLLTSLLRPTDTPVRPSMSELDRYADR